jgi:hypothetical protein
MNQSHRPSTVRIPRWLLEPTVHFFIAGILLFLAQRLIAGDPRTIVITPALRTDLTRRFRDQTGRWPNPTELDRALGAWKSEEALYREALRERLDREDETVRNALASALRTRAAHEFPMREPNDTELSQWLATHRELYETPRLYEYEYVVFNRDRAGAEQRDQYAKSLRSGIDRSKLGRPVAAAKLPRETIQEQLGPELAERICNLPVGQWTELENPQSLFMLRLDATEGGLPEANALRARMVLDWQVAEQQQAIERAVQAIVGRYTFVERSK